MLDKQMVEVKGSKWIPFKWRDDTPDGSNLGRAAFQICLKFERSRVSEFWVFPKQQMGVSEYWHFIGGDMDFTFTAYEGLRTEGPWRVMWCKEHKAVSMSIYAPPEAKYIEINQYGVNFWKSDFSSKRSYRNEETCSKTKV